MNILFRADGDTTIGGGHVMRCLTLALEAKARGYSAAFVVTNTPDSMVSRVRDAGFQVFSIQPNSTRERDPSGPVHSSWLHTSWQNDASAMISAAVEFRPDWIVWDHYGLDFRWTDAVRSDYPKARFLCIDDLDDRAISSELVLDQTRLSKTIRKYPADADITGPEYALLRPEFVELRGEALNKRNGQVSRILIAPGMVDGAGLAPLALQVLEEFPEIEIEVVMGSSSQSIPMVEKHIKSHHNCALKLDATNMSELMSHADLCIGAGGMTSWERCCLGLPTVAICTAENQGAVLADLESKSAVIAMTLDQAQNPTHFKDAIVRAIDNNLKMSEAAAALCDGHGAGRVVDILEAKLRPMDQSDAKTLYDWRKLEHIREASINSNELIWEEHLDWVEKTIMRNDGEWLIYSEGRHDLGHVNARPLGQDGVWKWGFYIGATSAPRGSGRRMLANGMQKLFQRSDVASILAEVRVDNVRSIALHKQLGFHQTGTETSQILEFKLDRCDVNLAAGFPDLVRGDDSDAP